MRDYALRVAGGGDLFEYLFKYCVETRVVINMPPNVYRKSLETILLIEIITNLQGDITGAYVSPDYTLDGH